jgi:hypothetical protein
MRDQGQTESKRRLELLPMKHKARIAQRNDRKRDNKDHYSQQLSLQTACCSLLQFDYKKDDGKGHESKTG